MIFLFLAMALAGDFERFTDNSLNYTQRNEACLGLRGNRSAEVIEAMRMALPVTSLQTCAGTNLRVAGAFDALTAALTGTDSGARAMAARELGTTGDPQYLPLLRKAADDPDLLVASNAIEGMVRYPDHAAAPQLREVAMKGGVLTSLAFETLIEWKDPEVLRIARELVGRRDPGDQLIAVRAIGLVGDKSDLPKLRELIREDTALGSGQRGFGLMPSISLSKAAATAIQNLDKGGR